MRSLNRCVLFGVSQPTDGGLAVRRRVPPVATRHLMRMPPHLRQAHEQWSLPTTRISLADLERARVLAEAMVETGDDPDAVERQLLALGVAPAAAIEATSLAISRGFSPTRREATQIRRRVVEGELDQQAGAEAGGATRQPAVVGVGVHRPGDVEVRPRRVADELVEEQRGE